MALYDPEHFAQTLLQPTAPTGHWLDMCVELPRIIRAVREQTLQCYGDNAEGTGCAYAGPCAIGVCLPAELCAQLDEYVPEGHDCVTSGFDYVHKGGLLRCPDSQFADWSDLQEAHDVCLSASCPVEYGQMIRDLETMVGYLANKYGVPRA